MGGIDDWATAKHPLAADVKKLPAAKFTAKVRADRLATTDYVKKNLKNKEVQILDVRTTKEFSGDDIRALRGGHIAGSVNIPYEQAWVDPDTAKKLGAGQVKDRHGAALKDDKGLAAIYKAFDPKKEVVALCQPGRARRLLTPSCGTWGTPRSGTTTIPGSSGDRTSTCRSRIRATSTS
jgi:thiosulfate/3-mercaptopyruvate sulfurtransferase